MDGTRTIILSILVGVLCVLPIGIFVELFVWGIWKRVSRGEVEMSKKMVLVLCCGLAINLSVGLNGMGKSIGWWPGLSDGITFPLQVIEWILLIWVLLSVLMGSKKKGRKN